MIQPGQAEAYTTSANTLEETVPSLHRSWKMTPKKRRIKYLLDDGVWKCYDVTVKYMYVYVCIQLVMWCDGIKTQVTLFCLIRYLVQEDVKQAFQPQAESN